MSRDVGQHTNGLDEIGLPFERTRARCGGGDAGSLPHASGVLPLCLTRNAANPGVAEKDRQCPPESGRTPSTKSNRLGNTQPASVRDVAHSHTTFKTDHLATTVEPLHHDDARHLRVSLLHHGQDTPPNLPSGRLREIALRCAIPIRLCSEATTSWYLARMTPLAPQGSDPNTPKRLDRALLRTAESDRPNCSQPIVGPGGSAKEQEEPRRLQVTHQRCAFQERLVFRHLTYQLRPEEFVVARRRSQLHDWQTILPSPNDGFWVQGPGSSGEGVVPLRFQS